MKQLLEPIKILWSLPVTIVGLFFVLFTGPKRLFFKDGRIIFIVNNPRGGMDGRTFGRVIILRTGHETHEDLWYHEVECHSKRQCDRLGPFMALYGLFMLIAWICSGDSYLDNMFEVMAYRQTDEWRKQQQG